MIDDSNLDECDDDLIIRKEDELKRITAEFTRPELHKTQVIYEDNITWITFVNKKNYKVFLSYDVIEKYIDPDGFMEASYKMRYEQYVLDELDNNDNYIE